MASAAEDETQTTRMELGGEVLAVETSVGG